MQILTSKLCSCSPRSNHTANDCQDPEQQAKTPRKCSNISFTELLLRNPGDLNNTSTVATLTVSTNEIAKPVRKKKHVHGKMPKSDAATGLRIVKQEEGFT